MIKVTRLDSQEFVINALYIEKVEALPDTTITLVNGKKYFVKDSLEVVLQKVDQFYRKIGLMELAKKVVDEDE